jgi:hypothetical protein
MRVIAFIVDPPVIGMIMERGPPEWADLEAAS